MKDLLTINQAAEELSLSRRRVQDLISEKRLPAEKVGNLHLIKRDDLKLVENRKKAGRPPKKKADDKAK